jgi:hypothetical protein
MVKRRLQSRLEALEQRVGVNAGPHVIISMEFVDPNGEIPDSHSADGGGKVWHILPDETQDAFRERVATELPKTRVGPSYVIFFPKDDGDGVPPAPIGPPMAF